ncbi:MAG: signal recognition particle protein [candidate division FCPU426 bacterium]
MFESLTEKLQGVFKKLSGQAALSESNIEDALKSVRLALLEADVHFSVVKDFLDKVRAKAPGIEVARSLSPAQVLVKVVHDELVELMGGQGKTALAFASLPPTVILMAGLQGTGKTTTTAKLARRLSKDGRRVLLCAADLSRPGAVSQLKVLGESIGVEVIEAAAGEAPPALAARARQEALRRGFDYLVVDTAGRLAIDEALMDELKEIKRLCPPHEVLLVLDAMQGADALETARRFHAAVGVDGLIMAKMDGDARGGAALSALSVTGKPIKFIGTGEKTDALEPFYPDRLASRILGMGDVVSLVEKVRENVDEKQAAELAKKLGKNTFDLADFMEQMLQIKKMGSMADLMKMIPGMSGMASKLSGQGLDDKRMGQTVAIIRSMTPKERRLPQIIHGERRKRIAKGSGTRVEDVNQLLRQFEQMKKMMKTMSKGRRGFGGGMPPGMMGGGMPGMPPGMPFGN